MDPWSDSEEIQDILQDTKAASLDFYQEILGENKIYFRLIFQASKKR
jgi:hypothetical protein